MDQVFHMTLMTLICWEQFEVIHYVFRVKGEGTAAWDSKFEKVSYVTSCCFCAVHHSKSWSFKFPFRNGKKKPITFWAWNSNHRSKAGNLKKQLVKVKIHNFLHYRSAWCIEIICTKYYTHYDYMKRGVADSSTQTILVTQQFHISVSYKLLVSSRGGWSNPSYSTHFIENWCILFSIMSLDRSLPCSVEVGPFSHLLPFVFDAQDYTRLGFLKKRMASSLVQVFPCGIVGRSGALNLKEFM